MQIAERRTLLLRSADILAFLVTIAKSSEIVYHRDNCKSDITRAKKGHAQGEDVTYLGGRNATTIAELSPTGHKLPPRALVIISMTCCTANIPEFIIGYGNVTLNFQ